MQAGRGRPKHTTRSFWSVGPAARVTEVFEVPSVPFAAKWSVLETAADSLNLVERLAQKPK